MVQYRLFLALLLSIFSFSLSGCATGALITVFGEDTSKPVSVSAYREAAIWEGDIYIGYIVESGEDRWLSIPLEEVFSFHKKGTPPYEITSGKLPAKILKKGKRIYVETQEEWDEALDDSQVYQRLANSQKLPPVARATLKVLPYESSYRLVIEYQGSEEDVLELAGPQEFSYRYWKYPIIVLGLPIAIAVDLALSPFYVIGGVIGGFVFLGILEDLFN